MVVLAKVPGGHATKRLSRALIACGLSRNRAS